MMPCSGPSACLHAGGGSSVLGCPLSVGFPLCGLGFAESLLFELEFVVDRRKHPMSVPSSNSQAFPPPAVVPHTRRDDGFPASKHGVLGHGKGLSSPSRSTFVRPE